MIWIDIIIFKYAMLFSKLIPMLNNKVLVTTRYSKHYSATKEILDKLKIKNYVLENCGGKTKKDKFLARLKIEEEFIGY
jgi:predicted glycosyltransferase